MSIVQEPRVVVTGGAGGLGRAFALHFAKKRASILIADVDLSGAEETRRLVEQAGGKAWTTKCNVADPSDVQAMLETSKSTFGSTDVLVNNAGVAVSGLTGDIPLKDWDWIMGINLWGVIYGCHYFIPMMKEQRSGHIINVASLAAIAQSPNMGPYNVTKAAVVAMSETLSAELHDSNIGVTVLCPSFFKTNIMSSGRSHIPGNGSRAFVEKLMEKSKLQAPDIARIAVEAAEKNHLYAVPHPEGKLLWAFKRLAPDLFHATISPRFSKRATR